MFAIATKNRSVSVAEVVGTDARSSLLQYEPAAEGGTDISGPPSNWFEGDVAAGLRTLTSDARVRGDFATGQRTARAATPTPGDQLSRRGRPLLWQSTVAVARRAS